jgi:dTDP-L-rhamnose 4-epimerase
MVAEDGVSVLVTGAEGFIGSHVLAGIPNAVAFEGDVTSRADWLPYKRDWDAVCHLAARVGTADSMMRPHAYTKANVVGTATMLQMLGHRVGRVVLASSAAVYGNRRDACIDDPTNPQSVYAATKLMQEQLCTTLGVPTVALRLFSVYGPGQANPDGGLVGIFGRALAAGEAPRVTEDGGQLRTFVYVSDVVEWFKRGLTCEPGVYNVGGETTTILDVAQRLNKRIGGPEPVVTGESRPGDVRDLTCYPDGFGFTPLWQGLDRYVGSL